MPSRSLKAHSKRHKPIDPTRRLRLVQLPTAARRHPFVTTALAARTWSVAGLPEMAVAWYPPPCAFEHVDCRRHIFKALSETALEASRCRWRQARASGLQSASDHKRRPEYRSEPASSAMGFRNEGRVGPGLCPVSASGSLAAPTRHRARGRPRSCRLSRSPAKKKPRQHVERCRHRSGRPAANTERSRGRDRSKAPNAVRPFRLFLVDGHHCRHPIPPWR